MTEMADLATHEAAVESKKEKNKGKSSSVLPPHHNGVSSTSLFDADFSHVIPPYLHLILGLVNDCVKEMLAGLEKLGCTDPAAAARQRERLTVLEDLEGRIGETAGALVGLLGPAARKMVSEMVSKMVAVADVAGDQAVVEAAARDEAEEVCAAALADADRAAAVAAGGAEEGVMGDDDDDEGGWTAQAVAAPMGGFVAVGELAAADWGGLFEKARKSAEDDLAAGMYQAEVWRLQAQQSRGEWKAQRRRETDSDRRNAKYARDLEAAAKDKHAEVIASVEALEKAIGAHDEYERVDCEGPDSRVDSGALVDLMKFVLGKHGINIQRYWNGALVGPDCRKLLEKHTEILEDIRKGVVAAGHGDAEAKDFVEKHTAVLKEVEVVSTITRRVDGGGADKCLSAGERAELKRACAAFGTAWRANYVDRFGEPRMLTPKGHIVEVHVPEFVDMFHACGVFGEDGAEALHVVDSLCRRIVRQMRNPEARHKAHTLHHLARSFTPELQRDIHTRQSKKKKDAAVAAAATAAAAAALIAAYVPVAVAGDAV